MLFMEAYGEQMVGGWDVNLCKALWGNGYRVSVDIGIRADHRFGRADG